MAIISLGGAHLVAHGRPRDVRCIPGFLPLDGSHRVILDPFPAKGMKGVLEGGQARLYRGDEEVASQSLAQPLGRWWTDLDLLVFAGTTFWTWIGLPLDMADRPGRTVTVDLPPDRPSTTRHHVLERDGEGNVVRHVEGAWTHELREHCEFGGAVVATRRRTRNARGLTIAWADVVAAALHGKPLN